MHVTVQTSNCLLSSCNGVVHVLSFVCPQTSGDKKRSGHAESNGFAGHINLPDLVQQSHSPVGTPTEPIGRGSTHAQEVETGTEVGGGSTKLTLPLTE